MFLSRSRLGVSGLVMGVIVFACLPGAISLRSQTRAQVRCGELAITVDSHSGDYQLLHAGQTLLTSSMGAKISGHWLYARAFPHHRVTTTDFQDALGSGREIRVTNSGLAGDLELIGFFSFTATTPSARCR